MKYTITRKPHKHQIGDIKSERKFCWLPMKTITYNKDSNETITEWSWLETKKIDHIWDYWQDTTCGQSGYKWFKINAYIVKNGNTTAVHGWGWLDVDCK